MKAFKVLGSGCSKCKMTAELIERAAQSKGVAVTVVKETDPVAIMAYGIMSTPGVVMDEKVIHYGSVPRKEQIEEWLGA